MLQGHEVQQGAPPVVELLARLDELAHSAIDSEFQPEAIENAHPRSGSLPCAEHGSEGPAIEGRLDVKDLSVLDLVPLRDQSRGLHCSFGFQFEKDSRVVSVRNDNFHVQSHSKL